MDDKELKLKCLDLAFRVLKTTLVEADLKDDDERNCYDNNLQNAFKLSDKIFEHITK